MAETSTLPTPTIVAIATARGTGGVAIIRISGTASWQIARTLFSKPDLPFAHGRFYHGWILDPFSPTQPPAMIDEVLLLFFKSPKSFTGEDVVEIHCHGGEFLSRKILDLCFQAGAQPAQAGEFTKRAFLSGRIDLTQAESVMDLISAQGEAMVQLASSNLKNRSLGHYIDAIGEQIIAIQSKIVASVDFPDEVDEPDRGELTQALNSLLDRVAALEASSQRNRMAREGVQVALLGMPNSGKSSLFNALLASERSIVTEIAGTTRDVITETLHLAGVPVTLIDTAGIRETAQAIEMMGIERSWQAAESAQAILYVYDVTQGLCAEDERILSRLPSARVLRLANKMDRANGHQPLSAQDRPVSAQSGQGLEGVLHWLEGQITADAQAADEAALAIALNQRQRQCLASVRENLVHAQETLRSRHLPLDIVTVPLTDALRNLDALMGRDTAEDVLTSVFQQFCVGK
jgi:tRNA modification GTPase